MSSMALLLALSLGLTVAAGWELLGGREERLARIVERRLGSARSDLPAKMGCAALGMAAAAVVGPAAPARLGIAVAIGLPTAGFVAPDALRERAARRRKARLVAGLPDALELLASASATGHTAVRSLSTLGVSGPLARELAVTVAEVECGSSAEQAIRSLRERVPGAEMGALAAALERSRRHGAPLAYQLREQATGLRRDARRRIEERAARAAPKIQLVVALVLVPSVLLMILAAILAHSDALFGAV
jgi:tight adherence protein C